jgi:hypothetical protein
MSTLALYDGSNVMHGAQQQSAQYRGRPESIIPGVFVCQFESETRDVFWTRTDDIRTMILKDLIEAIFVLN